MYVYFDYPAMSKIPKQLPNLTETNIILMDSMVSSITSTLILLLCLTIHSESGTRTALYHVHSYTVTVSYHSLWIRYQNSFISRPLLYCYCVLPFTLNQIPEQLYITSTLILLLCLTIHSESDTRTALYHVHSYTVTVSYHSLWIRYQNSFISRPLLYCYCVLPFTLNQIPEQLYITSTLILLLCLTIHSESDTRTALYHVHSYTVTVSYHSLWIRYQNSFISRPLLYCYCVLPFTLNQIPEQLYITSTLILLLCLTIHSESDTRTALYHVHSYTVTVSYHSLWIRYQNSFISRSLLYCYCVLPFTLNQVPEQLYITSTLILLLCLTIHSESDTRTALYHVHSYTVTVSYHSLWIRYQNSFISRPLLYCYCVLPFTLNQIPEQLYITSTLILLLCLTIHSESDTRTALYHVHSYTVTVSYHSLWIRYQNSFISRPLLYCYCVLPFTLNQIPEQLYITSTLILLLCLTIHSESDTRTALYHVHSYTVTVSYHSLWIRYQNSFISRPLLYCYCVLPFTLNQIPEQLYITSTLILLLCLTIHSESDTRTALYHVHSYTVTVSYHSLWIRYQNSFISRSLLYCYCVLPFTLNQIPEQLYITSTLILLLCLTIHSESDTRTALYHVHSYTVTVSYHSLWIRYQNSFISRPLLYCYCVLPFTLNQIPEQLYITSTLILLLCLTIHSESDTRTALYHVHSYTVTVSYHSLWIRYQSASEQLYITSTLILLLCLTIHSESDTRTALYHVHSYTVTVSYHSLWIRYQNSFIRSKTTNTEGPPLIESINIIYTIHINYSEACIKRSHLEQRKSGLFRQVTS